MIPHRPRILVTESHDFSLQAAALLEEEGDLILADLDSAGLRAEIGGADVLWVRLRHRIEKDLLAAAPSLTLIATPTTGLNHIDLDEARRRGIEVLSLKGETEFLKEVHATAEHTVALMLALVRHLPAARASVLEGFWDRDTYRGNELYGKVAGVVGFGRLGRIVAGYLRAFGMVVLAADPHVAGDSIPSDVQLVPLEHLLVEADLVTIHVDLSARTERFFGEQQFGLMKNGAWFINTSRGEVVEEGALIKALDARHLAGAALDVISREDSAGMGGHPLIAYAREHGNLLITPHIGGCTRESMEKTECFLARKVVSRLRDQDRGSA